MSSRSQKYQSPALLDKKQENIQAQGTCPTLINGGRHWSFTLLGGAGRLGFDGADGPGEEK